MNESKINTNTASNEANDEAEILALIERWAKAVRDQDHPGILANHGSDFLMFDVPPPWGTASAPIRTGTVNRSNSS